jgi:DNA-binding winged helix-turn-helix (wHTH) protein/tetratricopeptide (TPR) repeat protein
MLNNELPPVIRFGVFDVDRQSGELRKQGVRVRLRDQAFQVLLLLLERPGEVVTRGELQSRLWLANTFVDFDRGLNKAVNRLREALGDSAESPRFIETLPKRGYRFIAPVEAGVARRQPDPPAIAPATDVNVPEPVLSAPAPVGAPPGGGWILAAALVVVAVAAASYELLSRRPRPAVEPARVVIADFDNRTGDAAFDDTLKQALTIDLEQSPAVRIVSDTQVMRTLGLMHRRADERLTAAVARDVCRRTNGRAVLAGSLTLLNSEYVLGLNAIDCDTGETVAREQVRRSRKEDILAAVDDAAVDLRRKLGESNSSIQHFDKHVHDMLTTSSIEAFEAYTSGERNVLTKAGWSAIPFFQRAIDLDPDFAYAHAAIGLVLGNIGDATRARAHTERAYELRDRVSEWERFLITAQYYERVTGQIEKIPPLCDLWIQAYPRDRTAHTLMARAYRELGRYPPALVENERARRLGENHPLDVEGWVTTAIQLDRMPEATTLAGQAVEQTPDRLPFRRALHRLGFLAGDVNEMAAQVAWAMRTPGAEALFVDQSDADAYVGRVAAAHERLQRGVAAAAENDVKGQAAVWLGVDAVREAMFGNVEEARRQARAALDFEDSLETRALAAMALARVGDAAQARELADKLNAERPLGTLVQNYWLPAIRAEIEIQAGNATGAVELLRAAEPYELADTRVPLLPAYLRGDAYLHVRDGRAATEFQKLLQRRGLVGPSALGVLAHVGLARAHALAGDMVNARREYESFLSLWAAADSTIPILTQAKAEYHAIK